MSLLCALCPNNYNFVVKKCSVIGEIVLAGNTHHSNAALTQPDYQRKKVSVTRSNRHRRQRWCLTSQFHTVDSQSKISSVFRHSEVDERAYRMNVQLLRQPFEFFRASVSPPNRHATQHNGELATRLVKPLGFRKVVCVYEECDQS